jgi:hypothetical protein
MTRLASILGVATVATLVLLSGCEQAVKTDYAKNLAGTWKLTMMRHVPNPAEMPATISVETAVTAKVARTGTNKGTVSLTIADTITGAPAPHLMTTVKGSIEVTSDEITVSNPVVMPEAVLAANPAAVQLLAGGLTLEWDLSDDKLTVENETLFSTVLMLGTASLELTKQMANNSSR